VVPPSTISTNTMSAPSSPVCGRAWIEFSTFTPTTGGRSWVGAGRPVNGQTGSAVGVGLGVGEGVGDGVVVVGVGVGSGSALVQPAREAVEATSTDTARMSVRFIGLPRWEWTCPH